ncbi:MAG: GNAT family N-acetyltransferase [Clostridiales bacterium]|nr:MAG: GNAT family N-acetyltransferase [Clostridiales bacterium]
MAASLHSLFSLRPFRSEDLVELITLFRQTVWNVNCRDYSPAQLAAWAPENIDASRWLPSLLEHETVIAQTSDGIIVGFGDISEQGYLDRLYVHKDHQGQGVATLILSYLESYARSCGCSQIETHASITAQPFFISKGFSVFKEQQVERFGQLLTNYIMYKPLL